MKYCFAITFLILYGLQIPLLHAQDGGFSFYGTTYGLGRQDVTAIFLDSRDILWVGTKGAGLYQFGPGRFSQTFSGPEATGYDIRDIGEDEEGYLVILSEKGVLKFDGRDIIKVAGSPDIHSMTITEGALWWAKPSKVCRLQVDGKTDSIEQSIDLLIPGFAHDRDMVALSGSAMLFIDQQMRIRQTLKFDAEEEKDWKSATYAPDSTIWAIAKDGTLLHFNGYDFSLYPTGISEATDIASGSLGTLWISNADGLSYFRPWTLLCKSFRSMCLYNVLSLISITACGWVLLPVG
jgi:ligand-binding sensor domain-containing protein